MVTRVAQKLFKAARSGNARACLDLGRIYLDGGGGLAANAVAALNWLVRARRAGCAEAARDIAEKLAPAVDAASLGRDYPAYLAACHEMAAAGSPAANYALGEISRQAGQVEAALDSYRRAAAGGHAAAARRLGELHVAGDVCDASPEIARNWLEAAVANGDNAAVRALAELLWRQGDAAAEPWLRRLAQEGDAEAMVRLAERLLHTRSDARLAEVRKWLVRAVRLDHPRALWLWGRLHVRWLRGEGCGGAIAA